MSKNNKKLMDLLYPSARGGGVEGGMWGEKWLLRQLANMLSSTQSGKRMDTGFTQHLRRLGSGRKKMSGDDVYMALEREYKGSGKTIGGFIDFLLAPIKMIQNGIEHKAWNHGLPGGPNADRKGAGAEGGFGVADVLLPFRVFQNGIEGKRWDKGVFGKGASGGDHVDLGGKKPKKKRQQSPKQKKRAALIKRLMKENPGLTLPHASHLIKEHGLMDR